MKSPITLMTDFGTADGYVAQMKGAILSIAPDALVIDVTHDITPYAILEGALVLKGYVPYFPEGTVHVAVVDPGVGSERRAVALRHAHTFFIGPDNGLFSLAVPPEGFPEVRLIANEDLLPADPHPTFHGRDVFAPCAAHLSRGTPFEEVGPRVEEMVRIEFPPVETIEDGLAGSVIHIDRFGNVITNIEAKHLHRPVGSVTARGMEVIGISRFFGETQPGDPLALINSFGLLELSVNQGNAALQFDLHRGAEVKVRWQ